MAPDPMPPTLDPHVSPISICASSFEQLVRITFICSIENWHNALETDVLLSARLCNVDYLRELISYVQYSIRIIIGGLIH